jgi:hypothetical protein
LRIYDRNSRLDRVDIGLCRLNARRKRRSLSLGFQRFILRSRCRRLKIGCPRFSGL